MLVSNSVVSTLPLPRALAIESRLVGRAERGGPY